MSSTNLADRKLVFDAFWAKWKEFERTYGVTFCEQFKKDAVMARVRYYDIYPPLVSSRLTYSIDQSVPLMLAGTKPLGDDYVDAMAKA